MGKLLSYAKDVVVKDRRIERDIVMDKGVIKVVVKADEDGRYPVTRKVLNLLFNKNWLVFWLVGVVFYYSKKVDRKYPFPIFRCMPHF